MRHRLGPRRPGRLGHRHEGGKLPSCTTAPSAGISTESPPPLRGPSSNPLLRPPPDDSRQQPITGDDGREWLLIVSVGPDRVSRSLLVEANTVAELDALVAELVPTIVFRRADLQITV